MSVVWYQSAESISIDHKMNATFLDDGFVLRPEARFPSSYQGSLSPVKIFLHSQNQWTRITSTWLECSTRWIGLHSRTLADLQRAKCIDALSTRNSLYRFHVCGTNWQRFGSMGVHIVRIQTQISFATKSMFIRILIFSISVRNRCAHHRMCL